jgi:hypothetical protein
MPIVKIIKLSLTINPLFIINYMNMRIIGMIYAAYFINYYILKLIPFKKIYKCPALGQFILHVPSWFIIFYINLFKSVVKIENVLLYLRIIQ